MALLLGVGCSSWPGPLAATPPGGGDRVLFVGNSLTEANELPLMVEALAAAGGRPLRAESVVYGGASLEDHWGHHPSSAGSHLAALTIYGGLTGGSPLGLPRTLQLRSGRTVEVEAGAAPVLQAAAEEALASRK